MNCRKYKICLLGPHGFIGSAIAKELDLQKITWIGITKSGNEDERIRKYNFSDYDAILDIFNNSEVVINAIGSAKPKDFEDDPESNISSIWDNLVNITELLKNSGAKLVHISSAGSVYGEYVKEPHTETSPLHPISWYGKSKVIEELYFEKSTYLNEIEYLCLRVTNPYGNDKKTKHGFIDVLIHSILSDENFFYYKNSNPVRDFIFAGDMAFSIVELIKQEQTGIFNIGSGNYHSLEDITKYASNKAKRKGLISRANDKPKYDVLISKVSINKLIANNASRSTKDIFSYIDSKLEGVN